MKTNTEDRLVRLFLLLVLVAFVFVVGMGVGFQSGREDMQEEAVKQGAARFEVDGNRQVKFVWLLRNQQEKP